MRWPRSALLLTLFLGCGPNPTVAELTSLARTSTPTYSAQIQPILMDYCVECHTKDGLRAGGVELDRFESARAGGQHQVCVSVSTEVRAAFSEALTAPDFAHRKGNPACSDWVALSMPTGANPKLTLLEQVTYARWVEAGMPK